MSGPNINGKYSICKVAMREDSDGVDFLCVRWGYDSEGDAIGALKSVAAEENLEINDLAVIGAVFAGDMEL